jgi:hypothetical protein
MKILESNVVKFEDSLILVSDFASVGKRDVQEEDSSRSFIPFKMGAVRCLETSGSQDPMTRRHFPEHCNQINHCDVPKTNTVLRFV